MTWLRILPSAAALALAVWGALTVWGWKAERDALRAETASQRASIRALEMERDNARLARAVAQAARERVESQAAEYDALREALLRGNDDAPIPDWFRTYLGRLGVLQPRDADGVRAD